jgi:ribonucleoside-diphosphate reductase alpha chain
MTTTPPKHVEKTQLQRVNTNGHQAGATMRMMPTSTTNKLNALGEKIFLDRYALKDGKKESVTVGDTVVVAVNLETGQREIGTVTTVEGKTVTIELQDGEIIERDLEQIDKPLETRPEQMLDRVARGMAAVEAPEKRTEWERKLRWLLDDWKFVPGGRILTAAGTDQSLTFYNCYVIPSPQDSREGIMTTLTQMTEIMSRGGGVGINISSLRPHHAYVRGVNGRSSGAVSWGELYSFVTGLIEQGGSRRGALMLIMNVWHPDVLEFINSKRAIGRITNANISVGITDDFMEAVKTDSDWDLVFPDTTVPNYDDLWDGNLAAWQAAGRPVIVHQTVKARQIWESIIESAWASAEPGIFFVERYNKMSNSWYFAPILCTNPCGEQGLPAWGVCNLGALNLAKFVIDSVDVKQAEVDWESLRQGVRYAVRFLDNVWVWPKC